MSKVSVAIVQWAPEVHDAAAGVHKAVRAIAQAAASGARLIVFPEAWLPGYPYWAGLSTRDPDYHAFRESLWRAAIEIPGPEIQEIQRAAAQHCCHVVLGAQERAGGSLYAVQVFIGADGRLLGKHRKIMPTLTERLLWATGDGSDLNVYDTELGRLGGLMCFEHQMAPARYALCTLNVQIHVACWPGHAFLDPIIDASMRQLAHENACFVIVAREIMSADRIATGMPAVRSGPEFWSAHGGSSVIAPGGAYLAEPSFDVETLITAEIDLDRISHAKWFIDGAGHYSRPDIFRFEWDRRPKLPMQTRDD